MVPDVVSHNASSNVDALWKQWSINRSTVNRNLLVEHYTPWVKKIAAIYFSRFKNYIVEWEDYVQYGLLGLMEALERFQIGSGVPFKSYAYPRVKGAIVNGVSNISKQLRGQSADEDLSNVVNHYSEGLKAESDSLESWVNVIVDIALIKLIDLGMQNAIQGMRNPIDIYSEYRHEKMLYELIEELDERSRMIVLCYYKRFMSFSEIAVLLNLTKSRVCQIHMKAVSDLRKLYEKRY